MMKNLTCIECPKGCKLTIELDDNRVINVTGNECEKGERYAHDEIENPVRILTSSVVVEGLDLKMVPVRTDKPIPKDRISEAMEAIKKIRVARALKIGDSVAENFLGLGVRLIVTRDAS